MKSENGDAFYTHTGDQVLVNVKVTPGSSSTRVTGVRNGELCLTVNAPPEKGKANRELLKFLSKRLGVSRSMIVLKSGDIARHKVIVIPASALGTLVSFIEKEQKIT